MRRFRVEVTDRAAADLRAAYDWIARDSPARAAAWCDGLLAAAATLERFPARCAHAPESGPTLELRQLLHGPYRVIFMTAGSTVYIMHVRHAARRPLGEP